MLCYAMLCGIREPIDRNHLGQSTALFNGAVWAMVGGKDKNDGKLTLLLFYYHFCDLLTYLLTYSTVQSPSWEANWFAASQEIPRISRKPKVHYRTHKRPPPVPILGQSNPIHIPMFILTLRDASFQILCSSSCLRPPSLIDTKTEAAVTKRPFRKNNT